MMAHDMWSKLGSSEYDYNFTFLTPSTAAMYNMLPKEEKSILKVPHPIYIFPPPCPTSTGLCNPYASWLLQVRLGLPCSSPLWRVPFQPSNPKLSLHFSISLDPFLELVSEIIQ